VSRILSRFLPVVVVATVVAVLANGAASAGKGIQAVSAGEGLKAPVQLKLRAAVDLSRLASSAATSGGNSTSELGKSVPVRPLGVSINASQAPPSPPLTPRAGGQLGGFREFDGLNHRDQRFANNGQQFSLEPPDQGLCVGAGIVFESVNDVVMVYDVTGTQLLVAPVTENQFNSFPPSITRPDPTGSGGPPFGPFVSDPKCYFDPGSRRWFHTILEIDVNPNTGEFLNSSHVELAVSQSANPLGLWNIYELNTTDPGHPNCPCFGDQPLLGADANGIYLSTAEYSLSVFTGGSGFNGPQLYAFSKSKLVSGTPSIGGVHFFGLHHNQPAGCYESGTLQPAFSPQGISNSDNGGTEFLLSGRDTIPCDPLGSINPAAQTSITAWALTHTRQLNSAPLNLELSSQDVTTELYKTPIPQTQRPGFRPLGSSLGEPLPLVQANDDRMNQVVYANGQLWSGVNTVVDPGPRDGIAWFIVTPGTSGGNVTASMANQGYVSVANANVSFPSIGVNASGSGILTFSLMGPRDFPSHAYTPIKRSGIGSVFTAAAGSLPEDGFSCYPEFGGEACRWGDYSAAVADERGQRIWFAAEYIPNDPRTQLANWGTSIAAVTAP
jgi:hypothetical protein